MALHRDRGRHARDDGVSLPRPGALGGAAGPVVRRAAADAPEPDDRADPAQAGAGTGGVSGCGCRAAWRAIGPLPRMTTFVFRFALHPDLLLVSSSPYTGFLAPPMY